MASMIAENSYLINDKMKEAYADDNCYLMIVTDMDEEMNQSEEIIEQKLD
jgi:hypothetical protein